MSRHWIQRVSGLGAAGILLATLAAFLPANQALAQRPGGGGRGMAMLNSPGLNQMNLLSNESVGVELKLTDEQKTKAAEIGEKVRAEMRDAFTEFGGLDEDERQEALQELRATAQKRGNEVLAELATILKPEQMSRLKQISLQLRGVQALADEEVAAELKLTDYQKKQLTAISEAASAEIRELFTQARESGGDQGAIRTKMEEMRKASGEKALAVLDAEQKAQFEKMQGPKADIRLERGPGGGRGRRGPGG
jgi:Spy/CpxP family protein refolding chaperone